MCQAETADNELASILAGSEKVLGRTNKRGRAHRSTFMYFASGVVCFQTHKNSAVQRCCNLRNGILCEPFTAEDRLQFDEDFLRLYDLFMQEIDENTKEYQTANTAALAYRTAMPEPTNRTTVKSFIACVLHAMAIDILDSDEGAKLLNGARIASLALVKRPKNKDKNQESEAPAKEPATQSPESEIAAQKCA